MLNIDTVQGVIYDLDDTLLDNGPKDHPELWLHSRSRLAAIKELATVHGIAALRDVTLEENSRAFHTAATHSLLGAIWNVMYMKQLVPSPEVDISNSLYGFAQEVVDRKNELHAPILREYGKPVPGAVEFIKDIAKHPHLSNRQALATMAVRRDVDIFLDMTNLVEYFSDERIVSFEKIARPKPDPDVFEKAFRSLGLPDSARSSVLAFEDDPRGLAAAKAAGLAVCALTTRYDADDPRIMQLQPLMTGTFADFRSELGLAA